MCDIMFETIEFLLYPRASAVSLTRFAVSAPMRGEPFKARETALLDIPNFSAMRLIDTYALPDEWELFMGRILEKLPAPVNDKFRILAR